MLHRHFISMRHLPWHLDVTIPSGDEAMQDFIFPQNVPNFSALNTWYFDTSSA